MPEMVSGHPVWPSVDWPTHNAAVLADVAMIGEGFCPMQRHSGMRPRLVPTGQLGELGTERGLCPECGLSFALAADGQGYETYGVGPAATT